MFDFVKQNLVSKDRAFYLFETPPKRVLKDMNKTLYQQRLVNRCLLYFGWEGLDETKFDDGPFLDFQSLKDKIIAY